MNVHSLFMASRLQIFSSITSASKMRYLEFKVEGVPLVMIHGLGCASSFEYPHVAMAPALRGRHLFLIDLLGFGFSDRPEDFGYRVQDHALEVSRFIRERRLSQIDIYGHSMGGSIAIEVADLLEHKVNHLILSEANLDSGGGEFSRGIAALSEADYVKNGHFRTISAATVAGNEEWVATMQSASALAVYRGARSLVEGSTPDWRSRLLRNRSRKTFIFGERSLPNPDTEILALQDVEVLVVPGAGHSMGLENPHGLAMAITKATSKSTQR